MKARRSIPARASTAFVSICSTLFGYVAWIGAALLLLASAASTSVKATTIPTNASLHAHADTPEQEPRSTNRASRKSDGPQHLQLKSPRPGELISSPLNVSGRAPGHWYFEGEFPLLLKDAHGKTIGSASAKAQERWMTRKQVPFRARIRFEKPKTTTGTLVLLQAAQKNGEQYEKRDVHVRFAP